MIERKEVSPPVIQVFIEETISSIEAGKLKEYQFLLHLKPKGTSRSAKGVTFGFPPELPSGGFLSEVIALVADSTGDLDQGGYRKMVIFDKHWRIKRLVGFEREPFSLNDGTQVLQRDFALKDTPEVVLVRRDFKRRKTPDGPRFFAVSFSLAAKVRQAGEDRLSAETTVGQIEKALSYLLR